MDLISPMCTINKPYYDALKAEQLWINKTVITIEDYLKDTEI